MDKHEALSKYIEGHLHSDPYTAVRPTPTLLLEEITEFNEIRDQHKNCQREVVENSNRDGIRFSRGSKAHRLFY
jgi:hypothetical protein